MTTSRRPVPRTRRAWTTLKRAIRMAEARAAAKTLGARCVVLGDPVRVRRGVYDARGRLQSYDSTFTPPTAATRRALVRLLRTRAVDAVLLPLPRAHYHQTHRDAARLTLQAIDEAFLREGRPAPALYCYSDGVADLFRRYRITPNLVYPYGPAEERAKLALCAGFQTQMARHPGYLQEIEAKDRRAGAGGPMRYAERLLNIRLVVRPERLIRQALARVTRGASTSAITPYDPLGGLAGTYFTARPPRAARDTYLVRLARGAVEAIWRLPPDGRKPGHGLFLAEHLTVRPGRSLVDLGTGPLAFLGCLAAARGARPVWATDCQGAFIKTARAGIARHGWRRTVRAVRGDLFDPVAAPRVHHAVIHPPMLPAARRRRAAAYDEGGRTGRELLDRAITQAAGRLAPGGDLLIGQFEFLGVGRAFGTPPATFDVLRRHGFTPSVEAAYPVPITPPVRARLGAIRALYPRYRFLRRDGALWHRFVIVRGRRRTSRLRYT
ncbi:MAG: hypothetical protein A3C53_04330 [Omnitrophica WOR_2 bacterium RIFCSPHIGHO2_02_FULL_68_15]|nr:MAG: hypothetical protein A3C53_04330 [Omnitrophica WOR_2 bacterium RIFCSPHIGHO2_02_FULL_68_15]